MDYSDSLYEPQLSPELFWDVDFDALNWDVHSAFIITRVLTRGYLKDWEAIKKIYGIDTIKETALKARHLDAKSLSFLSICFNLPKEEFRCYRLNQSNPGLSAF